MTAEVQIDAFVAEHNLTIPPPAKINLGAFMCTSGELRVTDPCYSSDVWCAGTLKNVKEGMWVASTREQVDWLDWQGTARFGLQEIGMYEGASFSVIEMKRTNLATAMRNMRGRVYYLYVVHVDHVTESRFAADNIFDTLFKNGSTVDFDVGVDSGQAGFFDANDYPEDGGEDEAFYETCCRQTLDHNAGIVERFGRNMGAVSSTGWGDGSYDCHYVTDDQGQVIAAGILYIVDPEEE